MKKLTSSEIRQVFLDFFTQRNHLKLKGASIVPENDPTLLYINSGMAPLKSYFLGEQDPPQPRLCNVQPCIRTNDIEEVGDRHHLTFFEMLGSWSIGDYYKEGAIQLAFDLLVKHFEYDPQKLYATVYKGNEELGIPPDTESVEIWKKVGLPADHIVLMGEDNFWGPAGTTGPCGPCTEVFFDTGEEYGPQYFPGGHFDDANRYIEIWNAGVFMELNKKDEVTFEPLPVKSVDTGSGVERMYLALNTSESLYETDLLRPIFDLAAKTFTGPDITERDLRIVTDHMRSSTFILSEGIKPGRDGRAYIARRLIRKCVTVAVRSQTDPLKLTELAEEVIRQLGDFYPQLIDNREDVLDALRVEIRDFEPVIQKGLLMLDTEITQAGSNKLSGSSAFKLVTTNGVPFEIVQDFAKSKSVSIDTDEYERLFREHQEISRQGLGTELSSTSTLDLSSDAADVPKTSFLGYGELDTDAVVLKVIPDPSDATLCFVVTDKTTFYAEGGGQIGDVGRIGGSDFAGSVIDVVKKKDVFVHSVVIERGQIAPGDTIQLTVDQEVRSDTQKNHSATHLLHSALRSVLGSEVEQRGSLVNSRKLRFDFQYGKSMTKDEVQTVETMVNRWIWNAMPCQTTVEEYQSALDSGVTALFGEKYGDDVRVVRFNDVSAELCGGTHVKNSGEIGLFKILSEGSSSRGIRRIEAVTGSVAYDHLAQLDSLVSELQKIVGVPRNKLCETIASLKKSSSSKKDASHNQDTEFTLQESITGDSGLKGVFGEVTVGQTSLVDFGDEQLAKQGLDVIFLVSRSEKKLHALVITSQKATPKLDARILLNEWIGPFGGRGGGKGKMAQGGMTGDVDVAKIKAAATAAINSATLEA